MHIPLSIDGGTTTGWALVQEGAAKPRAGLVQMPDVEKDIGWWGEAFIEWLVPFSRLENVTEIVMEAPYIAQHVDPETGKSTVNANEIEKLVSLAAFTAYGARLLNIPFRRVARSTVCKHFIGVVPGQKLDSGRRVDRKYIKGAFLGFCQRKGWNVTSEDMADALGTLDWYVHDRDIKVGWNCQAAIGPLFERDGVRIDPQNRAAAARLINRALSFDRERPQ